MDAVMSLGSHSLHFDFDALFGFAPAVVGDNTAQSTGVFDLINYEAVEFLFESGTLADADATFAVAVLAGDAVDSVSAPTTITDEAVADVNCLMGTLTGAAMTFASDKVVTRIGYRPATGAGKRYVRATWTPSANTGNAPIACMVLAKKRNRP